MARLSDLPPRVRNMILAYLDTSVPPNPSRCPSQSRRSELGLYASVSRKWQLFFNDRLYGHLVLKQHCLVYFDKLVPRQRQLVRYLGVRHSDLMTVSESISGLFCILNSWGTSPGNELALEISAYSLCDVTYAVKGDEYLSSDLAEMQDMVFSKGLLADDLLHGWKDGQPIQSHDADDFYDIRSVVGYNFTRSALYNPSRQQWLPNLRHFIYEPWRPLTKPSQVFVDIQHNYLISESLPKTLKNFYRFEDFNEEAIRVCYGGGPLDEIWRIRIENRASSSSLARNSISFEQLTGCYSVDAVPFFRAVYFCCIWPNLTTLSLTCSLFAIPQKRDKIVALLETIGMAAQRMPQLQALDIWYGMTRSSV
ncbi:hypothetical protein V8C34DRAFT_318741 [Trichoderma compactum]